jgi:hypothetical protein
MLPGFNWLVLMLFVSPATSLITITAIIHGSAKAKSVEESQQRAAFTIIPVVGLIIGQASGFLMINAWVLFGFSIVCAIVGFILLRLASAKFNYESLLL